LPKLTTAWSDIDQMPPVAKNRFSLFKGSR